MVKFVWLLHLGRMPADVKTQLAAEGSVLYVEESICQTAIIHHFRAPGFYIWHGRKVFIGYFVLTECRFMVKAGFYNKIDLNLCFDEPAFKNVVFLATPKYLSATFDPSSQIPGASGKIEVRLHLSDLITPAKILLEKGAILKTKGLALQQRDS